jgi:NAD(P)-dependent dehydrogenase (short-subunit alcohol dehydrogenase family)
MTSISRSVAVTETGRWAVRSGSDGELLAVHTVKESALQHARHDLDGHAGGGQLHIYGVDGCIERSENRPGTGLSDEVRSAVENADRRLGGLKVLLTIAAFFVPSLATSLFSPTVRDNSDSFVGVVFATFTWCTALFLATLFASTTKAPLPYMIAAFAVAILITSVIAGAVGLQTMPFHKILELGGPVLLWKVPIGAIRLAIRIYGAGGAVLGAAAGIGAGIWCSRRIERKVSHLLPR